MWRFLRRGVLGLLLVTMVVVVLRGPLYRMIVHYEVIGERGGAEPIVSRTSALLREDRDLDDLIDAALDSTADRLHFSTGKVSSNPHVLRNGSPANCIGYAAICASLLQQELSDTGHADDYLVERVIGQLHIGSWNVHGAFKSPFWKDHDIVRITHRESGVMIYIDPTLYDVTGIGRVSGP